MRTHGSVGKKTDEYTNQYETLLTKYGDPLIVLFKLMKSRKKAIALSAATTLISYRFPKRAIAQLEVETQAQLVMMWQDTIDIAPVKPIELGDIEVIPNAQ